MRKYYSKIMQVFIDIALVILVIVALLVQVKLPDGILGVILPVLFPDTTNYATMFQEQAFDDICIGDDKDEVLKVLGNPLQQDMCDGLERWRYTKSGVDSHYRMRQITFDNGMVISKQSYYYID